MAKILLEDLNSEIPPDLKDLRKLPGTGRKTADVITSVVSDQPAMVVDTYVFMVSKKIGLVTQNAKIPNARVVT